MLPKKHWVALFIIILLYGLVLQEYEGLQYLKFASRLLKHVTNYIFLFLVAAVGYWGLMNYKFKWIRQLWVIIYTTAIGVLTLAGLIDIIFSIKNPGLRQFLYELRFFLVSPIPYALLLFISSLTYVKANKNEAL